MKKLKLIGTPIKVFKNTAFISGMFNSDLEVAKFEGAPPSLPSPPSLPPSPPPPPPPPVRPVFLRTPHSPFLPRRGQNSHRLGRAWADQKSGGAGGQGRGEERKFSRHV
jgi:hypothetical protein